MNDEIGGLFMDDEAHTPLADRDAPGESRGEPGGGSDGSAPENVPVMARKVDSRSTPGSPPRGNGTLAGIRIAGFELIKKIGQGGMGAVYLARQISMDRRVALKILPPRLARDELFVRRFLEEARISAKLQHRNIVSGIDVGESNGLYYFAMEYVPGGTVRDMIAGNGCFPEFMLYTIAEKMTSALAHAERIGLIHRDIKPDNIMIDERGQVKLLDLGLATTAHTARSYEAGRAVGTPNYISPEQAVGKTDIDGRVDIYCLGATLYHMATGRTMFSGRSRDVLFAHVHDQAPNVLAIRPELNPGIAFVLERMLAKSPSDRYTHATLLLEEWARLREGLPPMAVDMPAVNSSMHSTRRYLESHAIPYAPGRRKGLLAAIQRRPVLAVVSAFVLLLGFIAVLMRSHMAGLRTSKGTRAARDVIANDSPSAAADANRNRADQNGSVSGDGRENGRDGGDGLNGSVRAGWPADSPVSESGDVSGAQGMDNERNIGTYPAGKPAAGIPGGVSRDSGKKTGVAESAARRADKGGGALDSLLAGLKELVRDLTEKGWGVEDFPTLLKRAGAELAGSKKTLTEPEILHVQFIMQQIVDASRQVADSLLESAGSQAVVDKLMAAEFLESRAGKLLPPDRDRLIARATLYRIQDQEITRQKSLVALNYGFSRMKESVALQQYSVAMQECSEIAKRPELAANLKDWDVWSWRVNVLAKWERLCVKRAGVNTSLSVCAENVAEYGRPGDDPVITGTLFLGALLHLTLQEQWEKAAGILDDPVCDLSAFSGDAHLEDLIKSIRRENIRIVNERDDGMILNWLVQGKTDPARAVAAWPALRDGILASKPFQEQYPELAVKQLAFLRVTVEALTDPARRDMYAAIQREAKNRAKAFADKLADQGNDADVIAGFYMAGGSITNAQKFFRIARHVAEKKGDLKRARYDAAMQLQTKLAHNQVSSLKEDARKILQAGDNLPAAIDILNDILGHSDEYAVMRGFYLRNRNLIHTRQLTAERMWTFCRYARLCHRHLKERVALEFLLMDYPDADADAVSGNTYLFRLFALRYAQACFPEALDALALIRARKLTSDTYRTLYAKREPTILKQEADCYFYSGHYVLARKKYTALLVAHPDADSPDIRRHMKITDEKLTGSH